MTEPLRFLRALLRHWSAWLTGGALAAIFGASQGLHLFTVTPALYALFGIIAAGAASFTTWREEARRVDAVRAELAQCQEDARQAAAELDNEVIPDVPDDLYWLLAIAQRRGIRREHVHDHSGAELYAIWIGDTPVSHVNSRWFYELANKATTRGLLSLENQPGGTAYYRIPQESIRILEVSRRKKRPMPEAPGTLHSAHDGQPFDPPPLT